MICPTCSRDVPKLVGPGRLCPDCCLATSDEWFSSVFQGIFADAASCGTVDELADERCTTSSCGCVGDEAEWDSPFDEEPFDEDPEPSPPPTFRGVRRF